MTNSFDTTLASLRQELPALRSGNLGQAGIHALCAQWRAQQALMDALPPRYQQVAEDLLGRLEAGSLFTEESCSFSHKDLADNLDTWLTKASQTLAQA